MGPPHAVEPTGAASETTTASKPKAEGDRCTTTIAHTRLETKSIKVRPAPSCRRSGADLLSSRGRLGADPGSIHLGPTWGRIGIGSMSTPSRFKVNGSLVYAGPSQSQRRHLSSMRSLGTPQDRLYSDGLGLGTSASSSNLALTVGKGVPAMRS